MFSGFLVKPDEEKQKLVWFACCVRRLVVVQEAKTALSESGRNVGRKQTRGRKKEKGTPANNERSHGAVLCERGAARRSHLKRRVSAGAENDLTWIASWLFSGAGGKQ